MSPSTGNPGINNLARAIQGRIRQNAEAHSELLLDFGEIQGDYSLLTNTYPIPIPQSDYLICRSVSWGPVDSVFYKTQNDGAHSHPDAGYGGAHVHDTLIGPKYRWLLPGDRVLVAWVQNDAIVIDIILPATHIK